MSKKEPERAVAHSLSVCTLDVAELAARRSEFSELAAASIERTELEDGIAFEFEETEEVSTRLVRFIMAERRCCPSLTFELVFEPNRGPLRLRVRGPAGPTAFLEAMLPSEVGGR